MADVTVGVVGLGSIGRRVAELALTMGSRVVATRKRGATEARPTIETDEDEIEALIDMLPADGLPDLVAQSDFIVLALPLTPGDDGPLRCGPAFAPSPGRGSSTSRVARWSTTARWSARCAKAKRWRRARHVQRRAAAGRLRAATPNM